MPIRLMKHRPCTARTGAPSWFPFSNSVLRPNESMRHPALLDSLAKMGTSFSLASPARMTLSLQWYQRNASGWGKTPLRTLPRASPRVLARSLRLLYWMRQSWTSFSHAWANLSCRQTPKLKTAP